VGFPPLPLILDGSVSIISIISSAISSASASPPVAEGGVSGD
jgi:hypothetical protein